MGALTVSRGCWRIPCCRSDAGLDGVQNVSGKRKLLAAISGAFSEFPMPDRLSGKAGCGGDEYSYVENFFAGKRWTEISLESLREAYRGPPDACLSFMSHEAFRYFLPSFMWLFIERWEEADAVADAVIFSLIPTRDPILEEWQTERFSHFDENQRRVVADFLGYAEEIHGSEYETFELQEAKQYWRLARN